MGMQTKNALNTTLLIGNGLNRCLEHSISWGDLLAEIASNYGVHYNGGIPMPLEFESIVNQILRNQADPSTAIYTEIKKAVAEKVKNTKLPNNAIHHQLVTLPVSAIMTTNYDNLLEYVYNPLYTYQGQKNKTYLFEATSVLNNVPFFHIHGHADSPRTICLGYEHYMGVVENLRREINTEEKGISGKMKIREVLVDPSKRTYTWYERFYTDNIHIVGLGLSESEADLWWLITHRAYLYYTNYYDVKSALNNQITYYDIVDPQKVDEKAQKEQIHYMLSNANVTVEKYTIGENCLSYEDGYLRIFKRIKHKR